MKYEYDARRDGSKIEGAKGGCGFSDEIKTDYSKVRNETRGCRCRRKKGNEMSASQGLGGGRKSFAAWECQRQMRLGHCA